MSVNGIPRYATLDKSPLHPSAHGPLLAILEPDPEVRKPRLPMRRARAIRLPGAASGRSGPIAQAVCEEQEPELLPSAARPRHQVACHFTSGR